MQINELNETKDKIINITAKFLAGADGWNTVDTIKEQTVAMISTLTKILKIDKKVQRSKPEPQSEQEDL
jgi:hypothetical protein